MKNIFMVVRDISSVGGINRVVSNLCSLLAKDYKITIVSCTTSQESPAFEMPLEVCLIHFNKLYPDFSTKSFLDKLKFSYRFNKLLPKDAQNFVIVHQLLFPFFKAKNTTYIRLYHGNFEDGFKKYLHKKPLFPRIKLFDLLVILHDRQMDLWQKLHSNIKVIPNFIDTIPQQTTDYLSKIVLSMGRFTEEKGFERLIDIWKIVQESSNLQDWKLHLVGEGKQKELIIAKIKLLNLQDSIVLKPFTQQVAQEYQASSIFVLTSHRESFGMTLLEAGSYGLPCLAFDVGGGQVIENEKSGFLIPNDDLESFAIKLQSLMESLDLRKFLGNNAKLRIQEKFTSKSVFPQWQQILQ